MKYCNFILDEKGKFDYIYTMSKSKVQNRNTKNDPVLSKLPLACSDEHTSVEFIEPQRWDGHSACLRCGDMDVYQIKAKDGQRQKDYRWRWPGLQTVIYSKNWHGI